MALIGVQRSLCRLPSRIPDRPFIGDVVILAIGIIGDIIVTITGDAEHLRVFIEAVTAACIGYDREKIITSKVIDPGKWRFRGSNHIFSCRVIKIAEFHGGLLFEKTIKLLYKCSIS